MNIQQDVAGDTVRHAKPPALKRAENTLESVLFASRWLMAPFYLLMVGALCMLLVKFAQESWHIATHTITMTESEAVLGVLSLIDITLTGNLLLMVLFAGYENFVSKMDVDDHEDRPDWMGKVDFAGLKLKLVASIVAISGINLLKNFMALDAADITDGREKQLMWMVIIHLVFIVSGVMLAFMDRIVAATHRH
ncbi:TIGR00645 family protein [Aurantiacibacter gangjinensis]|nr:TIGR00645 family protein [Aurantiacibacter gangjinensis]APE27578.1 Uncharacterized protein UPF0114 [Aurantiacibacter gangjinensis]